MSKLVIVVPVGRRASGRAVLLAGDGRVRHAPFRVLATASGSAASQHGNPERDWRRPFGDTPTGSYVIAGALPPSPTARTSEEEERSDLLGALVLAPVGGNALEALRAGRMRFLICGGPLDSGGRLRSTCGGLRVSDADLASLFAAINEANADCDPLSSVEVDETSAPAWTEESIDEVPSSRGGSRKQPRASSPVTRDVLATFGFGKKQRAAPAANPGRRAFLALALFTFGAFACGGSEGVGAGGAGGGGGDDGGEGGLEGDGASGAPPMGGPPVPGDAGTTRRDGTGDGTAGGTGGGGTTGGTTTGTDTTTTGTVTTGTVTTGTDTTTTGTVTTGTDTTTVTTGTDTVTTGTVTTGTDTTTTGTDTTTTGTDTTTTGTDTTTTGTDTTTTGTDTTTTGTDTGFARRRRLKKPPRDGGSGL